MNNCIFHVKYQQQIKYGTMCDQPQQCFTCLQDIKTMSLLCPDHTDEAVAIGELQVLLATAVQNSILTKSTVGGFYVLGFCGISVLMWHVDSEPGSMLCRV